MKSEIETCSICGESTENRVCLKCEMFFKKQCLSEGKSDSENSDRKEKLHEGIET